MLIEILMVIASELTNPPMRVSGASAELAVSEGNGSECVFSSGSMLSIRMKQIATSSMDRETSKVYRTAMELFAEDYSRAIDKRDRAAAVLNLEQRFETGSFLRNLNQTWFLFDDYRVSWLMVVDSAEGGVLFRLRDEVTGRYLSVSAMPADFEKWSTYVQAAKSIAATDGDQRLRALEDLERKSAGATELIEVEVDGQVRYLDTSVPDFRAAVTSAVLELWAAAGRGEGQDRILLALAVGLAAEKNSELLLGTQPGFPTSALDPAPLLELRTDQCRLSIVGASKVGDIFNYSMPPEELVESFFGESGFPVIDPSLGFVELMAETQ
jgi:hypothetical protein